MVRRLIVMALTFAIACGVLSAEEPFPNLKLKGSVEAGHGVADSRDNMTTLVPSGEAQGMVVYLGFSEVYGEDVGTQLKPLNNEEPIEADITGTEDSTGVDRLFLYVYADANVVSSETVSLKFSSEGWHAVSGGTSSRGEDPDADNSIFFSLQPLVVEEDGKFEAVAAGDDFLLTAGVGKPGNLVKVGQVEISWVQSENRQAGDYAADVYVKIESA